MWPCLVIFVSFLFSRSLANDVSVDRTDVYTIMQSAEIYSKGADSSRSFTCVSVIPLMQQMLIGLHDFIDHLEIVLCWFHYKNNCTLVFYKDNCEQLISYLFLVQSHPTVFCLMLIHKDV